MTQTILTIHNRHGQPDRHPAPVIEQRPGRRLSYFENTYAEQLVFVYDAGEPSATLYHGDNGWEPAVVLEGGRCPTLVLAEDEQLWLRACWLSIARMRKRPS